MVTQSDNPLTSTEVLQRVLLDLLAASTIAHWPGADGVAVDDIVKCYPQAIAAGEVPGWHDLQCRFPELSGALQTLRTANGWLETPACRTHTQGDHVMQANVNLLGQDAADDEPCRLARWLVSFATGSSWYPVGEFLALDETAAIERAVEVFGPGAAYQAEEIPWDAAPLSKANRSAGRN